MLLGVQAIGKECNAENQFSNFERVFRSVMSVPKAEVLKREANEKYRNARKRAKKKGVEINAKEAFSS
jgi:hypothetical protein